MTIVLTFLHIVCCVVLIGVVLLQTGKRADLAGAFGGGGSQTAFGARGAATVFSKATTICAVVFMLTSFTLSMIGSRPSAGTGTVLDKVPVPTAPAPKTPAAPAPAPTTPAPAPAPQGK